jgi:hypothetical protein
VKFVVDVIIKGAEAKGAGVTANSEVADMTAKEQ